MTKCNIPQMTEEQQSWLDSKTAQFNCIYIGFHGSHTYGLDRPESDIDVKAVYLPSKTDLILGTGFKTKNYKNDELDIEIEIKSLPHFLRDAKSGDTNCIDMLHSPDYMALFSSKMWELLKGQRANMYAKNMKGMIGYIKTHSKKYTNKIDRFTEMSKLLDEVEKVNLANTISAFVNTTDLASYNFKYIKPVTLTKEGEQQYLEVCGKKYIYTWSLAQLRTALVNELKRYGKRTAQGVDVGLDTKSLSHALRVLLQLKEIILTKDLKFPLMDADYVRKVKLGEITDVTEVLNKIDTLFEECMMYLEESNLPEDTDLSGMYKVCTDYYFGEGFNLGQEK